MAGMNPVSLLDLIPDGLRKPLAYIGCGLLVVALCVALWARGNHYRGQRDEARTALKDQVAEYRRVYAETFAKQWAAKMAEDTRRTNVKTEADNATEPARKSALASADAYAAAHRVQPRQADPGNAQGGNLSRAPAAAQRPAEPATGTDMVAISRADFDACTLNTADLNIAYQWGRKLAP